MDARLEYEDRLASATRRLSELSQQLGRWVWIRSALFFGVVVFVLLGYFGDTYSSLTKPSAWLFSLAFLCAIVWNEHLRNAHVNAICDQQLFQRLIARVNRDWGLVTPVFQLSDEPPIPGSDDLDVEGRGSLLSLLSLAGTHPGQQTIQTWLSRKPTWQQVLERQVAVKALVPKRELRLELLRRVSNANFAAKRPYGLSEWASEESWLRIHRFAHVASYVGPLLLLIGVLTFAWAYTNGLEQATRIAFGLIATGAAINLLLTVLWGSWIHDIFHRVAGQNHASWQFTEIFKMMSELPDDQAILTACKNRAVHSDNAATNGLRSLNTWVRLATLQHNVLFYVIYLALQLTFVWDFRVLRGLESWRSKFGSSVASWFQALGDCEAVLSCATLADEHPQWSYAVENTNCDNRLEVKSLGHPLLPNRSRVTNNLIINAAQPLLLVTGSNMAGKSTFMRAVGLNLLLMRTGSPVCATSFRSEIYGIGSSIRVRDDLQEGVSFFMAELRRLKSVVDLAAHPNSDSSPLFFLLDEVLQGTNSRERQIAVAHVAQRLIQAGATGILSTHDLDLANNPDIAQLAQVVHFREYFEVDESGRQTMKFDYIMRPGSTPTTNALKLLELVGLSSS